LGKGEIHGYFKSINRAADRIGLSPMQVTSPESAGQLKQLLADCQHDKRSVQIRGAGSKDRQGGAIVAADVRIETTKLNRVLAYDPRDLTISVEAGMLWRDMEALLAEKNQMVALDPPFSRSATVGGVLAANSSGPRRRLYGTARDLVIGMTFATLEGRIVESGGMVVKNVAGLDFSKLLIGSMGTLAAMATVNFKLMPKPAASAIFYLQDEKAGPVFAERNRLLASVLQPTGMDVLSPKAAERIGLSAQWTLVVEAAGSAAVLARYSQELGAYQKTDKDLFAALRDFTEAWLDDHPAGSVLRLSTRLQDLERAIAGFQGETAIVARGGNGIAYVYSAKQLSLPAGQKGLVEFSPQERGSAEILWPSPGEDFFLMEKIKLTFDPDTLLNRGRLYGRI
jgi:glycolate oxidase FAD binding subunit